MVWYEFSDYKRYKHFDLNKAYKIFNNWSETMMINAVLTDDFRLALDIICEEIITPFYINVNGENKQIKYGAITNIIKYCMGKLSLETYMDADYSQPFNEFIKYLVLYQKEIIDAFNSSPLKNTKKLNNKIDDFRSVVYIKFLELDGFKVF